MTYLEQQRRRQSLAIRILQQCGRCEITAEEAQERLRALPEPVASHDADSVL